MEKQVTVLVAVSDEAMARQLPDALSDQGWEVIQARDAVAATAAVIKRRPQAVVLDGDLPGGGGVLTLRRLRASVHTTMIPVLAIEGTKRGNETELMAAGADEVVPSPAVPSFVISWIGEKLGVPVEVIEAPASIIADSERLMSLERTGLLNSPPSEMFDSLTRAAAAGLGVPVALVSLVDEDRQFFKSQFGLPEPWATVRETPLSHSFCQWVVSGHEPLVVSDAREHEVLRGNRAVNEVGVLAYAGMPLTTLAGYPIGSFCAVDTKPRAWSAQDLDLLEDLAQAAEACVAVAEWDFIHSSQGTEDASKAFLRPLAMKAIGEGIEAITSILRRGQVALGPEGLATPLDLLEWLGKQIVHLSEP